MRPNRGTSIWRASQRGKTQIHNFLLYLNHLLILDTTLITETKRKPAEFEQKVKQFAFLNS